MKQPKILLVNLILALFVLTACDSNSMASLAPNELPMGIYPVSDYETLAGHGYISTIIWADPDEDSRFTAYTFNPDRVELVYDAEDHEYVVVSENGAVLHLFPQSSSNSVQ